MGKFFTPSKISENIKETPEGYLLCLGVPIARTGWQEYGPGETPIEVGDDGRAWIYRDKKEVFRPQTVASFNAKPITIKHPEDFVTPENWKELSHGTIQNPRKGDEKDEDNEEMLIGDLLVTDEMAIGLIRNGLREVSCGYDAEYEETGKGEGKQYNIIGNHVALVEHGRAGSTYAIRDHRGDEELMDLKEMKEQLLKLGKTIDGLVDVKGKKLTTKDDGGATPEQTVYDELKGMMKDMSDKIDGMMKGSKDDEKEEKKPMEKKEGEDEDEGEELSSRVKALEACVAKMLKKLGSGDEEEESSEDEGEEEDMSGGEDEEESEDDDMMDEACDVEGEEGEESQKKTGDAALIEILTPGKKFKGKGARAECLKEFAKTKDGKKMLADLGMKKPTVDSKSLNVVFLAASALMKSKRGTGLEGTKDVTKARKYTEDNVSDILTGGKSAEEMNEINAKFWDKSSAK